MIHLGLQTEYSFRKCFGKVEDVVKHVADQGCSHAGIADLNNTFGHIPWAKACDKYGIKPIFGVRLWVTPEDTRRCNVPLIFIAKSDAGLEQIYKLVKLAYDNFYYIPRLYIDQLSNLKLRFPDVLIGYPSLTIPSNYTLGISNIYPIEFDFLAIENRYINVEDEKLYQIIAGVSKRGEEYIHNFDSSTYPKHILSQDECKVYFKKIVRTRTHMIADKCTATLPKATMTKYNGERNLEMICWKRLDEIHPNWNKKIDDVYEERLEYELELIKSKGYMDYFMITADMVADAKKSMLVGPSRGSSAGSLVCYLLGITEIDPIKYDLLFERFIDVNRLDLPDIDIDFPDRKRKKVIKYLQKQYGSQNVAGLGTVNTLKPKSAIKEFALGMNIPLYDTEDVKNAIIERSSGDARAAMCINDTFETTEPGQKFIESYPEMQLVTRAEGHAVHSGKHAAGIIVSDRPLTNYGGIFHTDRKERDDIIQMDKKSAEHIDLLKIDILGLRTLSVLEETADQIGMEYKDIYDIPLDDVAVFDLFNNMRLNGIFQFEGQALRILTKQMGVHEFNDIVAITALARPGALNSGGAARYVKYRTGKEEPRYYSDLHKEITEESYGVTVYQEQMMRIAKEIGQLTWDEVQHLRRAASKSLGDEFFAKYREIFLNGALKTLNEEKANELWNDISYSGSWTFNKSHAVAYGLISYWTSWFKAHYPLEFAVGNLNNARDVDSATKLLRDFVRHESMEYVPVDPDKSDLYWSVNDGKLLGGLMNIDGIGEAKANQIQRGNITPALFKKLADPKTDFDILFPTKHYWGKLYNDPLSYGLDSKPTMIEDINEAGEYMLIGKLISRNLRDLNEYIFRQKRENQELIEEDNLYLLMIVEDDTDSIMCKINRWKFEEMGREIAEQGKVGESWYLIKGNIKEGWRKVEVTAITNLENWLGEINA